MTFGLDEKTLARIRDVFSRHADVEQAIIYGSRALGTEREGSDIDITLKGCEATQIDLSSVLIDLEDLNLPWFFDLSDYHQLSNPELLAHIDHYGKVLYQRH